MKTTVLRLLSCVAASFVAIHFAATETLPSYTANQAVSHVGETATVCGKVASTYYSSRGNTFLNLDAAYPDQLFAAFIPASSALAGADVRSLEGKNVCVTGKITLYRGKPQILVTAKEQIQEK